SGRNTLASGSRPKKSWVALLVAPQALGPREVPLALLGEAERVPVDEAEELLERGVGRIGCREPLERLGGLPVATELVRDAHGRRRGGARPPARQRRAAIRRASQSTATAA